MTNESRRVTEGVEHHDSKGFFSSLRVVSGLTFVSRVLGLIRDCVCLAVFGAGREMSAFYFAFAVPNLFRRLFGEGALSAAFIPAFAQRWQKEGPDSAWSLFRRIFGTLLFVLGALTGVLYIVLIIAGALLHARTRGILEIPLLYALLPYLPVICVIAFFAAALQARKRFTLPALAPVLNNLFWIAAALTAAHLTWPLSTRIFLLPAAILAAAALAVGLLARALSAQGASLRPEWRPRDPGVREVAARVAPVIVGLSIVQFNVFVDVLIARVLVSDVANAHLFPANRLFQFPLAMLGISMGVAVFPTLAHLRAQERHDEVVHTATSALEATVFLALPAAIGLVILAHPIVRLFFQHGAFTAAQTAIVAPIVVCYAIGLAPVCANQVLVRLFYATGDTRTPVRVAIVAMFVNLAANLTLVWSMREAGLALATSISGCLQCAILLVLAAKRLEMIAFRNLLASVARTVALSAAMGALTWGVLRLCVRRFGDGSTLSAVLAVVAPLGAAVLFYFALARVLGFTELRRLLSRRRQATP